MVFGKQQKYVSVFATLAAKLNTKLQTLPPALVLAAAAVIAVIYFTLRDHGVYATVMWDEWEYNRYARQLPLRLAEVPYYLYYLTYSLTRLCGDGFLSCVQFMNAVFLAAAMPFIYLVGRRTASQNASLFVAIASIFGGISVYATHFVPEPMYFFGFWLGIWALLKYLDAGATFLAASIGAGCGIAILSLVKLHALFLVPGFALFFIFCGARHMAKSNGRKGLIAALLVTVSFLVVRLLLGYLFAGAAGFNIFGTTYTGNVGSVVASSHTLTDLLTAALPLVFYHATVIVTLYAVPLLIVATTPSNGAKPNAKLISLQALAVCLLVPLLIVVACYSAQVRALNPEIEGSNFIRLHLRYYSFLFPMLALIAASYLIPSLPQQKPGAKKFILGAGAAILIIAFVYCLPHFQLSVFDGPELRGFATIAAIRYLLLACALVSVGLWTWNARRGALFFLAVFFPLMVLMSGAAAFYSAQLEKTPNLYHQAGLFIKTKLGSDLSRLAIVSPDFASPYQTMFVADNPDIEYKDQIPAGSCLTFTPTANGKEWFLLIGSYNVQSPLDQTIAKDGYRLVHVLKPSNMDVRACEASP